MKMELPDLSQEIIDIISFSLTSRHVLQLLRVFENPGEWNLIHFISGKESTKTK